MKFTVALKDNRDFRRLYSRGKFQASSTLVLYWRPNRLGENRVGITVSTKLGHAVVRNRIRRRLREIYRLHEGEMRRGLDLVMVARARAVQVDYWKLDRDFCRLSAKLGIRSEPKGKGREEC